MEDDSEEFAEIISEPEKLAILFIGYSNEVKSTRLQKMVLVAKAILEGKVPTTHGAYLFGGYSDDIDEGTETLRSEGFLSYESGKGFYLSDDGNKIFEYLKKKETKLNDIVYKVSEMFKGLSDKQVTAITYKLFPQLTENSVIKEEMEKIGKNINIETFKLKIKQ
jgi:hypothetical protein